MTTTTAPAAETLTLRPTGIQTYLSCPRKYFFGYVENAPRLTSAALAIGSAVHRAAEVLAAALRASKAPKDVLPAAEATLAEQIEYERTLGDPDPDDDKFETALDVGVGLVRTLAEAIPPTWRPADVEKTVAAELVPGVIVSGTTDWVLADGTIVDLKTRARKSNPVDIRRDLQGTAYAALRNAVEGKNGAPRRVVFVEVTKTKVPQVVVHDGPEADRDARDFETYRGIVTKVGAAIRAGYDPPAPSSWCGSCQHRRACPITRA